MLPPMARLWHRREEGAAPESAGGGRQLVTRAAWRRPPPPAAVPPSSPLPSLAAAEPSQGGGGRKLSRAGSPRRPGRASPEIARDPGPPRARLDPSAPARPPRTDLTAAGAQLAARGPCFGSLLAGPAPAPRPACRRFVGAPGREGPRGARCPRRRRHRALILGCRARCSQWGPARARPAPGPARPGAFGSGDTPLPWGGPEAGRLLALSPPAEGIRGGGARRGRRAVSEGVGARARRVRSPIAPLGAQGGQAQASVCTARSPSYNPAADWGLNGVSVGESDLRGFT